MIEYNDGNLLTKVLVDNSVNGSAAYSATDKQAIDLCLADVYLYLATHPDTREGAWSQSWTPETLIAARVKLFQRYGLTPPEIESAVSGIPTVTAQTAGGNSIW